jgi:hypothetical protein
MKKTIIFTIFFIINFFYFYNFSHAQLTYNLLSGGTSDGKISENYTIRSNESDQSNGQLRTIFGYAFDLVIGISIALAVILFMTGAFGNMFGDTSIRDKITNKDMMKNSVLGLILVLTMYLILQTISPDLVKLPLFNNMNFSPQNNNNTQPSATMRSVN